MPVLAHLCKSSFFNLDNSLNYFSAQSRAFSSVPKCSVVKTPICGSLSATWYSKSLFLKDYATLRRNHVTFCSKGELFDEFTAAHLPKNPENDRIEELRELELLNKPSPVLGSNGSVLEVDSEPPKLDKDEVLEPFFKFFRSKDSELPSDSGESSEGNPSEEEKKKVSVEYYEPKPGDFVVGVVVSGNENKLDVNVGADLLGTMLTKEVLPLYGKEMEHLLCDPEKDAERFMVRGKVGIVINDDAVGGESMPGRPVVEPGTILFAEVLGRTLSGRPLLSTRRLFRRIAWHRVRQIKQLNEPIEVTIREWNTGGLLARVEGLRAFLPKAELINRVNNFTELKQNVGRGIYVQITRINEETNDLILSEKEAWEKLHLQEGTLLEGTVRKILPYGVQIRIGETNRSGLLHISNISRVRVTSVSELLAVEEKVKVLVVKSMFPEKISLSTADLEREPGLFISDKEKVFSEAEEMAKKYRARLTAMSATRKIGPLTTDALPFDDEANFYSNWEWFQFERDTNEQ